MIFRTLNLEEDYPTCSQALDILKTSIIQFKQEKTKCLVVIHGYGSSGKGGIINKKSRQWLKAQEKNQKIKTVIFGEKFNIFNMEALRLKNKYPELNQYLTQSNNGITIVEL